MTNSEQIDPVILEILKDEQIWQDLSELESAVGDVQRRGADVVLRELGISAEQYLVIQERWFASFAAPPPALLRFLQDEGGKLWQAGHSALQKFVVDAQELREDIAKRCQRLVECPEGHFGPEESIVVNATFYLQDGKAYTPSVALDDNGAQYFCRGRFRGTLKVCTEGNPVGERLAKGGWAVLSLVEPEDKLIVRGAIRLVPNVSGAEGSLAIDFDLSIPEHTKGDNFDGSGVKVAAEKLTLHLHGYEC